MKACYVQRNSPLHDRRSWSTGGRWLRCTSCTECHSYGSSRRAHKDERVGNCRSVLSMLVCALLALGVGGCGVGFENSFATSGSMTESPPTTLPPVATGVLVTDSTVVPPTSTSVVSTTAASTSQPTTSLTTVQPTTSPTTIQPTTSSTTVQPTTTTVVELSPLEISDQQGESVVQIFANGCGRVVSGSGFAIDSTLVVTAAHVVKNTNQPTVRLRSGAVVSGTVIGRDETWDVAVIQAPDNSFSSTAKWGDVDSVREGTALTVIGYPDSPVKQGHGAYDVLPVTVRSMISSGAYFEVSAGPDHGNSGGPAFDALGEVVGLLLSGESTGTADYAYVISSMIAAPLVQAMIAAPGAPEPACAVATVPPTTTRQAPAPPATRNGEEYRGTWVTQVASLPIDVDIDEAKREFAHFLTLDPGFVPVLSADWPATFDRADRIILIRGGFGSRAEAESACASWGLAVPGNCLARLLQ